VWCRDIEEAHQELAIGLFGLVELIGADKSTTTWIKLTSPMCKSRGGKAKAS
jgi:hypothetical protein